MLYDDKQEYASERQQRSIFRASSIMLVKIFTLRFSEHIEGFDDEHVRNFMINNNIISIREHFFQKGDVPYWSIMLVYEPMMEHRAVRKEEHQGDKKDDYRSLISKENMPLFNLLREWRNERAIKDGVPPYVLFTNRQLAEIAEQSPDSINKLAGIEGIGKMKLKKYGREVLSVVHNTRNIGIEENQKRVEDKIGKNQG